uniref:Uncharacterized protein n=1 Tax=Cacopsylla melanoneura TaxID=428564 RepID=A0A8D8SDU0_9HEMI
MYIFYLFFRGQIIRRVHSISTRLEVHAGIDALFIDLCLSLLSPLFYTFHLWLSSLPIPLFLLSASPLSHLSHISLSLSYETFVRLCTRCNHSKLHCTHSKHQGCGVVEIFHGSDSYDQKITITTIQV